MSKSLVHKVASLLHVLALRQLLSDPCLSGVPRVRRGTDASMCLDCMSGMCSQVYAAVQLVVSSNGSADVSGILTEADTSLASKLVVPAPVRRPLWTRRKTGTSTPDASFTRPSISRR